MRLVGSLLHTVGDVAAIAPVRLVALPCLPYLLFVGSKAISVDLPARLSVCQNIAVVDSEGLNFHC